ncbi:MAG TPA: hypothetical protein VGT08_13300 [Terracidiphilus sp.]|nr:hypothetical protein [Terracidiphilus sp.]
MGACRPIYGGARSHVGRSKCGVAQGRTDAAQGDLELAWAELREAKGTPELQATELKSIEPHVFLELSLDQELALAANTCPDLMALGQAQSAQSKAVCAAKSEFGPRVITYGNWEDDRGSLTSSGSNNWVDGIQISVDIIPLGKCAQLARSSAAKQRIDGQLVLSQQERVCSEPRTHSSQDSGLTT